MTAFVMVFVAGALGSSHCLGMCGPIALALGSGPFEWKLNFLRQMVFTSGRVFTYAFFGAIAGAFGLYLQQKAPALVSVAAVLAIVAGLFLIYQGLLAAQLLPRRATTVSAGGCLSQSFFASFLRSPGMHNAFLAGLFTGMLPCGLVYGFLALAASSSSWMIGAATMAAFGLGTAPVMILTGCGGNFLNARIRGRIHHLAAWCVILTGLVSIARGAGFVHLPGWISPAGCPLCN